jgi:peptide/nickel transport system permease protein
MVGTGQQYIQSVQHLMLFPCLAIALTMLAFTFLGDGLRDALDVKMNE